MSVSEIPEFREAFRTALPGSIRCCVRESQFSHLLFPIHRPRPEEILDLQPSRLRPLEDRALDLRGEVVRQPRLDLTRSSVWTLIRPSRMRSSAGMDLRVVRWLGQWAGDWRWEERVRRGADCGEPSPLSGRPVRQTASGTSTGHPDGKKRQSLAALHTGAPPLPAIGPFRLG